MKYRERIFIIPVVLIAAVVFIILPGTGVSSESAEPLEEKYQDNPELIVADLYSERFDVTTEEALQRFDIADAFSKLNVDAKLQTYESGTYGGLWIQHEPSFRVVIAFTQDGEEKVKKYVPDDFLQYVEVRNVAYTYHELVNTLHRVAEALRDMGIRFDAAGNIRENCIEFNVLDRTEIDRAIDEGTLVIPECVRIIVVEGLIVAE